MFLGSFVEGVTGSFGTVSGSCMAYLVDITDNRSRSIRLGIVEVTAVFAAMASFLIGGILLKNSGNYS